MLYHISGSGFLLKDKKQFVNGDVNKLSKASKKISIDALTQVKIQGTAWDAAGNVMFGGTGIRVSDFDAQIISENEHIQSLEFSADANDSYVISFFKEGEKIYDTDIAAHKWKHGLTYHTLKLPSEVKAKGFDQLALVPITGDGRFSLGHMRLTTFSTSPSQKSEARHISLHQTEERKLNGTQWNAPGTYIFSDAGLWIDLQHYSSASSMLMSLDSNDSYVVQFGSDEGLVASTSLPLPKTSSTGLYEHRVIVPESAQRSGFNWVSVVPLYGDRSYSLGHLILLEDKLGARNSAPLDARGSANYS